MKSEDSCIVLSIRKNKNLLWGIDENLTNFRVERTKVLYVQVSSNYAIRKL
jgi:hypothetical protein